MKGIKSLWKKNKLQSGISEEFINGIFDEDDEEADQTALKEKNLTNQIKTLKEIKQNLESKKKKKKKKVESNNIENFKKVSNFINKSLLKDLKNCEESQEFTITNLLEVELRMYKKEILDGERIMLEVNLNNKFTPEKIELIQFLNFIKNECLKHFIKVEVKDFSIHNLSEVREVFYIYNYSGSDLILTSL